MRSPNLQDHLGGLFPKSTAKSYQHSIVATEAERNRQTKD